MKTDYLNKALEIVRNEVSGRGKSPEFGSLKYFLGVSNNISQSEVIRFGRKMEQWWSYIAEEKFTILDSGVQCINGDENKDIDLILGDDDNKIIYYYELKSNIQLDSEKQRATKTKVENVVSHLKKVWKGYTIEYGILFWSIFNNDDVSAGKGAIQYFINNGIPIVYPEDYFNLIGDDISSEEYYEFGRKLGEEIKNGQY